MSNFDLENAGLGADGALHHWLQAGGKEGRPGDTLFGREQTDHILVANIPRSSAFETANDHDWFSFTAHAGQTINLDYTSGTIDGIIELHDSRGHLIATSASGPSLHEAMLSYAATADDIYYAEFHAANTAATGNYNIDLHLM